ncbi:response regulator transcription factor [Priestia megaterium]|jgi:DNA-binding NarL/FixJ family response regulator|uniref:Response regulator n=2 Tax=Priestia megaterium TaxID=1404 RepID=A0A6M6DR41_PRIMG|nr:MULTISPECIES: response regulator transcription factor [Priestia]MCJ7989090.1 response regulator transcription factor [Priestia sp. OVS21]AJI20733.1 bacterial regulatory s, luxR family protein [Priestia megaterium NBRC 15308 = ATCC 14581]AYE51066.1 response regulator transcription factor [Priestia megaterium NCT-2]KFM97466.1 bacterial regulatory s, luxR family protein [Priestia megaterium]KGJ84907.1 LuxR family transcriptional regulator [Priestia megaterium NBRC 15308 = ATCC 14581]
MKIKILIADDHHVVRKGLVFFLQTQPDLEVVGEASNGEEALKLATSLEPHIVLMDLSMPVLDGIEATKELKKQAPHIQVMILTSFSDQDHVIPALEAGASGYQLKESDPDELVAAIRKLMNGENQLHPKVTTHLLTRLTKSSEKKVNFIDHLTKREKDVLKEIAKGKSNKEIGASLHITEKTVKTHVSNILSKLGVQDRTQAALYAVQHGIS